MAKHIAFDRKVVKLLQDVKTTETKKNDLMYLKLLVGKDGKDKISVLSCIDYLTLTLTQGPGDDPIPWDAAKTLLPGGVKLCGFAGFVDDSNLTETVQAVVKKYEDLLYSLEVEEPIIAFLSLKDTGVQLSKVYIHQTDHTLVEPAFSVTDEDLLKEFILARATCQIPLSFLAGGAGVWQTSLHNEIETLRDGLFSESTLFHLNSSNVILGMGGNYNIPDESTCDCLPDLVRDDEEEGFEKKKKKSEKSLRVVKFDVYHDLSNSCSLERVPTCAPIVNYSLEPLKTTCLTLPIDVVVLLDPDQPVTELSEILCSSITDQLVAAEKCLCQFPESNKDIFYTPVPYHFKPMNLPIILTAMLPHSLQEDKYDNYRWLLHSHLCLPTDRPLFRTANRYVFPDEQHSRGYLYNVHEGLPPSKVKDGTQYLVEGRYTYHHYMQDRFDDNKWGCAYRSLQTLVSWFKLQGYTSANVPGHREIQQALVDVGDKEVNFVGSRKWIGSMEVSFCLDHLIGVTSRILSVNSGADLSGKGRELAAHFSSQGTPIMIGGGVLAHTILGVDYNEITGDINFLILDPHYTGAEDLKVIQDKGWCGWKRPEFWDPNTYYNLCMPQRPKAI